jgi:hypothetical protein
MVRKPPQQRPEIHGGTPGSCGAPGSAAVGCALTGIKAVLELTPDRKSRVSPDVMPGTARPRAVGSEWDIAREAVVKSPPEELPFIVSAENVTGKVSPPEVKTIDGREFALIRSTVSITPSGVHVPGFKPSKTVLSVKSEALVPADDKAPVSRKSDTLEMTMNGTVDSPNGKRTMETHRRLTREMDSKPAP